MKHCQRFLTIAMFVGAAASAQAQAIVNGNFTTNLSGWTTPDSATEWLNDLGPDSVPGVVWLNDVPGPVAYVQQTVSGLTPGQAYDISGFYKSRDFFYTTGSFTATIDGVTDFANPETSFVTNWTPFSFDFTPSASSVVLRVNGQVGSDSDYDADEIAIASVGTATPEPGSIALLMGLGLSGSGLLIHRRKRAVKAH
jgi:hypothetical protein